MKKVLLLGVVSAALILSPLSASADSYQDQLSAYKVASQKYKANLDARRLINETFSAAVKKANLDFKTALSVATTAEQKSAAKSVRDAAITAATTARDSAIAALGPVIARPTPPAKPVAPMKGGKAPKSAASPITTTKS